MFLVSRKFIFKGKNSFNTLFAYGNAQWWLIWRLKATFNDRHNYPTTCVIQSCFVLSVSSFWVLQVFVLTIWTILIRWDWFIFAWPLFLSKVLKVVLKRALYSCFIIFRVLFFFVSSYFVSNITRWVFNRYII